MMQGEKSGSNINNNLFFIMMSLGGNLSFTKKNEKD